MIDMKVLGNNIRTERKRQLLTIEQLAEKVNITDNFLGKIERGDSMPSLPTIERIASALHVSIDFLLKNEEQRTNSQLIQSLLTFNELSPANQEKFVSFIYDNIKYFK